MHDASVVGFIPKNCGGSVGSKDFATALFERADDHLPITLPVLLFSLDAGFDSCAHMSLARENHSRVARV